MTSNNQARNRTTGVGAVTTDNPDESLVVWVEEWNPTIADAIEALYEIHGPNPISHTGEDDR